MKTTVADHATVVKSLLTQPTGAGNAMMVKYGYHNTAGSMISCDEIQRMAAQTLATNEEIILTFIFGSAAHGFMRDDSDVNIALDIGKPLTLDDKLHLVADLSVASATTIPNV